VLDEDGGRAFAEGRMAGEAEGFEVGVAVFGGGVVSGSGSLARGGFG